MKILVDNSGYDLKNHGDTIMLVAASSLLKNKFPQSEIRIFTNAAEKLYENIPYAVPVSLEGRRRWKTEWNIFGGLHKLFPMRLHLWLARIERDIKIKFPELSRWWINKRLARRNIDTLAMNLFLDEVKTADIVVATGGGFITDLFYEHGVNVLQTLALAQSYGKPTAMFGQGMGPLLSVGFLAWAKKVLPKLELISLREALHSKPLAQSVGVSLDKIKVTGDDAISYANKMTPEFIGDKIGINVRIADYSGFDKKELIGLKSVFDLCSKKVGAKLCGVPISSHDGDSDFDSLCYLLDLTAAEHVKSLDTYKKVIQEIGTCRVVITGSYHGGVLALSQGISVVGIASNDYYRYKFQGLSNQFGCGCTIIDRNSENFNSDLEAAVLLVWGQAEELREELLLKAKEQSILCNQVYEEFSSNFRSVDAGH